jgi:hypothetical protein
LKRLEENKMYNTYLMWIGSESYETMDEWIKEAEEQGVSKRLPNANVGMSMKNSNSVVFVAHDEGEWRDCPDCTGTIQNPEYRVLSEKIAKLKNECRKFEKEREEIGNRFGWRFDSPDWDAIVKSEAEEELKILDRLLRKITKREKAIVSLKEELDKQDPVIESGTGGKVDVVNISTGMTEIMDYRKYDYWHRQPKKFNKRWTVVGKEMCKTCGGKGQLPEGRIFGLFIPTDVEYVLREEDSEEVKKIMGKRGFRLVDSTELSVEKERKCGYRKKGGVYAVAKTSGEGTLEDMIKSKKIKPQGVEIKGDFIKYLNPVSIDGKRFRGVKRWNMDGNSEVEEETIMILDALE